MRDEHTFQSVLQWDNRAGGALQVPQGKGGIPLTKLTELLLAAATLVAFIVVLILVI